MTHAAPLEASCDAYLGWPERQAAPVRRIERRQTLMEISASPRSSPPRAATISASGTTAGAAQSATSRRVRSALITFFGDVNPRAGKDHILDGSGRTSSGIEDLLDHLVGALDQPRRLSLRRWLRSSWNSRRLRCRSRSCSTSSRWRRLRSASGRSAHPSSLSAAAFQRGPIVELLVPLREVGLHACQRAFFRAARARRARC